MPVSLLNTAGFPKTQPKEQRSQWRKIVGFFFSQTLKVSGSEFANSHFAATRMLNRLWNDRWWSLETVIWLMSHRLVVLRNPSICSFVWSLCRTFILPGFYFLCKLRQLGTEWFCVNFAVFSWGFPWHSHVLSNNAALSLPNSPQCHCKFGDWSKKIFIWQCHEDLTWLLKGTHMYECWWESRTTLQINLVGVKCSRLHWKTQFHTQTNSCDAKFHDWNLLFHHKRKWRKGQLRAKRTNGFNSFWWSKWPFVKSTGTTMAVIVCESHPPNVRRVVNKHFFVSV